MKRVRVKSVAAAAVEAVIAVVVVVAAAAAAEVGTVGGAERSALKRLLLLLLAGCWLLLGLPAIAAPDPVLPAGAEAVWDLNLAWREPTPSRERICLNGLWRWQPASSSAEQVPLTNWGYFKVPGSWPGITDYLQKDCQTVFRHPSWSQVQLASVNTAWSQRQFTIPQTWTSRRIVLTVEYLNSLAIAFVDGKKAGELQFPGGEIDLSSVCHPGQTHTLTLLVAALPLQGVMRSYTDSAAARDVKGFVARRGLCGDVFIVSTPGGARLGSINVTTSVRRRQLSVETSVQGAPTGARHRLRARITQNGQTVREFTGSPFATDQPNQRAALLENWMPEALWDIHTPTNQFNLQLELLDSAEKVVDTGWSVPFGFREFWIDGRDFYLNGSRIFLSAVPLDNGEVSAAAATYSGARESFERLKSFGINFVYTHNYGCEPGSHLSFTEILRAADDVGMLVSLSQPHFSHYEWKNAEADATNGYARHAAFYSQVAANHPSVVTYSMSHNATGYSEDMNPDMIDGVQAARDSWATRNVQLALRAETIVRGLDPSRLVYHHASGNLGTMHPINFYPNFAPVQELSDWFEHWSLHGVKPAFTCEYGAPFTWDWTMYRGWFRDQREFGSAVVPWEFCLAEWNSQFLGDSAFRISEPEKANLRWEAEQLRQGKLWHRWDYPADVGSRRFDERYPVFAMYLTENWRAFRTWGVSATSPWEYGHFWKLRPGVSQQRRELPVDWPHLQRPGYSPDFVDQQADRMDLAFERADWISTPASDALIRNNGPLLAYIAGKPARFTSKDHNFLPGETIEKQLIVLNNSRRTVTCDCTWSLELPQPVRAQRKITVETGQQERIPLRFDLPSGLAAGQYTLRAKFAFSTGETQEDQFRIDILPPLTKPAAAKIALFDPAGTSAALLKDLGVSAQSVRASSDLSSFDLLIVGREALSVDGAAPGIDRVRTGLRVLVLEQSAEVLEKRFGFRVAEYGLRQVFPRLTNHPALAGLTEEHLRDWKGEATLLAPRLKYRMRPRYGPTVLWCDLPVTRVWRCGNRGNVASVLIEKPACGDFLPIIDGGFGLQYSPLLEYREGQGMVLFCQLDVTGRSERERAADRLLKQLVEYAAAWKAPARRHVLYAGADNGPRHLEAAGFVPVPFDPARLTQDTVLVVGRGGAAILAPHKAAVAAWLNSGGRLLSAGLGAAETAECLPFPVSFTPREYISGYFPPFPIESPLAGVSSADVHNRDPRELPLVSGSAFSWAGGVLGHAESAQVTFCQLVPWEFNNLHLANIKRTFRHASFLFSRLLSNLGAESSTPILERFEQPLKFWSFEKRWLRGLYLDQPEEWDDPYRFFRW